MKKKKILLKSDAIETGSTVFFTGKPCKDGHIAQRYVTNNGCLECIRLARLAEKQAIKLGRKAAA